MQTYYVINTVCVDGSKPVEYDKTPFLTDNSEMALLKIVSISDDIRSKAKDEWTFAESVLSEDKTVVEIYIKKLGLFFNGPRMLSYKVSFSPATWVNPIDFENPANVASDELTMSLHLNPKCEKCSKYHDASFDCSSFVEEEYAGGEDYVPEEIKDDTTSEFQSVIEENCVPDAMVQNEAKENIVDEIAKDNLEVELKKSAKIPRSFSWLR